MNMQKALSYTRQAIEDYHMISDHDVIAVGLSGGKDSFTLLSVLARLQTFYPHSFTLHAITVDLGFSNQNFDEITKFCESLDIPYHIVTTQIADIIFENRKESNPCSLCAKLRKGALNQKALELGCNKIAYAHHMDDVIETMFLSLLYEGRFSTFSPVTKLDRTKLTLIRPLIYIPEYEVIGFTKRMQFPVAKNPCPADGYTKRESVKQLLHQLEQKDRHLKKRLFHAIVTGSTDDWKLNRNDISI